MKLKSYRMVMAPVVMALAAQWVSGAFTSDYYATSSALSSGKWVKIKVKESGIHQITDEELRQMGFSNPERVAVYGYRATELSDYRLTPERADDLPAVAMTRHDGKLLFYGEGDVSLRLIKRTGTTGSVTYPADVKRNYYADYGTYFLTDAMPQVEPERVEYTGGDGEAAVSSYGMVHVEEELFNDGTIGARFLGERFTEKPVQTFSFSMPGFVGGERLQMMMVLGVRVDQSKTMKVTLPSGGTGSVAVSPVKAETYAYQGFTQLWYDAPQASADGSYSVKIDATGAAAGGVDYFTISYPRHNDVGGKAQDVMAFMELGRGERVAIDGAGEGMRLWFMADGEPMRELEAGDAEGNRCYVVSPADYSLAKDGNGCYILAFDPEKEQPGVEFAGEVANQNLHGLTAPDMLIVTTPLLADEAERLAQAHRTTDGIDVAVVGIDEVYNEFSSGTPHLMAVRRLARMLADREPGKLRSILLMGAASYDNRGLASLDKENFYRNLIPMYMREDIAGSGKLPESYASDAVVGMLDEDKGTFDIGRGKMTVNVGRIPAHSVEQAHSAVGKIIKYMTTPVFSDLMNRAVLMCDDGDKNGHMADTDSLAIVISEASPQTTCYKAYNTVYPFSGRTAASLNKCVKWVLEKGTSYMAYCGHATTRDLGTEKMWGTGLVADTEYAYPPLTALYTCRALYYDHYEDNLGEAMLYRDNGGAIAVVGALREVYKEYNLQFAVAMSNELFSADHGTTYGDVFRMARNRMVPVTSPTGASHYYDLIYNTLSYNYIGDPELKVPVATHGVALQSVGAKPVTGDGAIAIGAECPVVVKGCVTGADGDIDRSFDGEVTISVFDGEHLQSTINHDSTSSKTDVVFDEDLLYERKAEVKGGEFELSVYLPRPNYGENSSRISFWATSADGRMATGACDEVTLSVSQSSVEPSEEMAPEITEMYVNDRDFRNGDLLSGDVTLHVEVAANEIGVVAGNSSPGRTLRVTVDGGRSVADAEHSFVQSVDGGGVLDLDIDGLADGRHEIELKVFNNAGQSSSRKVEFTIVNRKFEGELSVMESPAVSEANIALTQSQMTVKSARLTVKNGAGVVVFSDDNASFPYCWNLKDNDGRDVAPGVYEAEAYVAGDGGYGYASGCEIVVMR